ncbi:hypothetical protein HY338_03440 [Candidatus Gottesmanbacteria bacterium]|nr:hypothetical protein [Candidatus Gottesmanbacteria bacterium]
MDKIKETSTIDSSGKMLVKDLEDVKPNSNKKLAISAFVIIIAGMLTGYTLSVKLNTKNVSGITDKNTVSPGQTVGVKDQKAYKDSAEGELQEGGINGEGTHKLIRPGGPSQTVYLTSSNLDLNQFIGKKVRVWGETFSAQKAGWLMDVGKVEILN